jgi:condensin complex subunit 3
MLAHNQLPETLIDRCLDVLTIISPSERELIRVVVEIVLELRDEDDGVGHHGDGADDSVCILVSPY